MGDGMYERYQRERALIRETYTTLHALASLIESMAQAMEDEDNILGALASEGVANHLAALPKHVRDVFMEHLSDEAARGLVTDRRYHDAVSA